MAKGRQAFGHQLLAEQLSRRLLSYFDPEKTSSETSLTIGVFGEWGSGKSNLLELIKEAFKKPEDKKQAAPVIVVPFNPWRYEKEEHLLVPLLKTIQLEIMRWKTDYEQNNKSIAKDLLEKLGNFTEFVGMATIAFARGFKGKVGLPGTSLGIELDVDKAAKALEADIKQTKAAKDKDVSDFEKLNSYYYEFEQQLQQYTCSDDGASFKLLFLIDDLDRCLPEKAVEMLESIKLFLDVEGCAFVLALDDEVVERGIIHRYRDYLFQGNGLQNNRSGNQDSGNKGNDAHLSQLPITGIEYLEKIIQLPFRLPQPSENEIVDFLQDQYKDLFAGADEGVDKNMLDETEVKTSRHSHIGKPSLDSSELLKLFARHIPAVPRKQIRAAELFQLSLEMAKARECEHLIQPLVLAKLTLLQLFAPDLYRFGRRRFSGFMKTLEEWSEEPFWRQKDLRKQLEARYKISEINAKSIKDQVNPAKAQKKEGQIELERRNYHRYYSDLIAAFEKAVHNRSGFDLYQFIQTARIGDENLAPYFSFVDEGKADLSQQPEGFAEDQRPEVKLSNPDDFVDLLFSETEGGWQSAVQQTELAGKVLDDELFERIMQQLQEDDFSALKDNPKWLAYLSPHLKGQQLDRLDVRKKLLGFMLRQREEISKRAEVGRALGRIGDQRAGVSTKSNQALPDIDWVVIPEGSFKMGSKDKDAFDNEKPTHEVPIEEFLISRYPVTNAQYRCFVDAGGYQDETLWNRLPEAARWWKQGGEADQKLIATIKDKDIRERYRKWLAEDTVRDKPRYWDNPKWNMDNHPVVGVSWFETLAYTVWLDDRKNEVLEPNQIKQNGLVRLPTEEEWEYAARGETGYKYAWGNEPDKRMGNYDDTGLDRTSPVGLFSEGEAFGLHDMSGNVWEWTSNRWGKEDSNPDFSYTDWNKKEQIRERYKLEPVEFRVVRGGSWDSISRDVRCAVRFRSHPDLRYSISGFRVVYGVLPGLHSGT